jgi:small subunit ribosomal protein S6
MAKEAPIYDLVLLLSASAEEDQRKKILSDVESAISKAGGSIERSDDWGRRPLAYEIRHTPDAEYHLLQFRSPPNLIEELSHTLRITDGVLRFRVIKVRPGTPDAPSTPPPVVVAATSSSHSTPSAAPSSAAEPASPPPSDGDDAGEGGGEIEAEPAAVAAADSNAESDEQS